jgi:hypothetical protein
VAKRKPIDDAVRRRVVAAIAVSWAEGCPVADWEAANREKTANVAIRRWQSLSRRGIPANDNEAQVRDMARGLVEAFEDDPRTVGPVFVDYQYLASKIIAAIQGSDADNTS